MDEVKWLEVDSLVKLALTRGAFRVNRTTRALVAELEGRGEMVSDIAGDVVLAIVERGLMEKYIEGASLASFINSVVYNLLRDMVKKARGGREDVVSSLIGDDEGYSEYIDRTCVGRTLSPAGNFEVGEELENAFTKYELSILSGEMTMEEAAEEQGVSKEWVRKGIAKKKKQFLC